MATYVERTVSSNNYSAVHHIGYSILGVAIFVLLMPFTNL